MKKKILIVMANYYKDVSLNLMKSAMNEIKNAYYIKTINVPGIFEIPVTISKNIGKYDGFIALGCVIKGQTPHFDFISKATTDHIMKISVDSKKPVGNGIITCLNMKQAIKRKHKGKEASQAVISVLSQ
tara:strand:- start:388 stop:774 length:387 start_codon:yes stop_codon:yes gene_type:complete